MAHTEQKNYLKIFHVTGDQKDAHWVPIGAAFPHKKGIGFNLVLNYMPTNSEGRLVAVEPKDKAEEKQDDKR